MLPANDMHCGEVSTLAVPLLFEGFSGYPTYTLGITIFQSLNFMCLRADPPSFGTATPNKPDSLGNGPGELRKGQGTQALSSCITPEQESGVINSLCHSSRFKKR